MKSLLKIVSIALAVYSAQACRTGSCKAFCAGEIKDPTKKQTFYTEDSFDYFNSHFYGDEQFCHLHDGECIYDEDCSKYEPCEICAIPEPGASGFPKTFRNFCEINQFNCDNPENEYVYYHDVSCNELDQAILSDEKCDCLDCSNAYWEPVCAYPSDPELAEPITASNFCWLQNYNCGVNADCQLLYWHEGLCLNDPFYKYCEGC